MSNVTTAISYFPRPQEGFITSLQTTIAAPGGVGATGMVLNSTAGYATGDVVCLVIDPGNANKQVFTGVVGTGNAINSVVWTEGSNVGHIAGAVVIDYVTATHIALIQAGLLKQHKQSGAHAAVTADSLSVTGSTTLSSGVAITGNLTLNGTRSATVATTASAASITPSTQVYDVTALAVGATIAVPSFSPANGMGLIIRIKDNGSAQALSFAAGYSNVSGLSTPTTTVAGKLLTIGALYNSTTASWEIQGINQSA